MKLLYVLPLGALLCIAGCELIKRTPSESSRTVKSEFIANLNTLVNQGIISAATQKPLKIDIHGTIYNLSASKAEFMLVKVLSKTSALYQTQRKMGFNKYRMTVQLSIIDEKIGMHTPLFVFPPDKIKDFQSRKTARELAIAQKTFDDVPLDPTPDYIVAYKPFKLQPISLANKISELNLAKPTVFSYQIQGTTHIREWKPIDIITNPITRITTFRHYNKVFKPTQSKVYNIDAAIAPDVYVSYQNGAGSPATVFYVWRNKVYKSVSSVKDFRKETALFKLMSNIKH